MARGSERESWGDRLYRGASAINFVGRRRTWFAISAVLLLLAIGGLVFRGLNLSIEFRGGALFTVPSASCTVSDARDAAAGITGSEPVVTETGSGLLRVQTEPLDPIVGQEVTAALADACGVTTDDIATQVVGPTWGAEITAKAIQGLVVFLVLVIIFLSIYFEWRMALAAMVALVHDLVITVGIYALTGLQVSPATLIGLLTILGYSLYDTVVVFDRVKEDTRGITGQSMRTYGEAANLSLNQVLVRSINTTVTSLIPVLAIIVIGAGLLGAGTLLDLAVALAIGMAAGTYSSIFIAVPTLVVLKQRQPDIRALDTRVHARRVGLARAEKSGGRRSGGADEGDGSDDDDGDGGAGPGLPADGVTMIAGPRTQPKKAPRSKRGRKG